MSTSRLSGRNAYREILENDLIQEGAYGVKDADVDAVAEQKQQVAEIGEQPLDGVREFLIALSALSLLHSLRRAGW